MIKKLAKKAFPSIYNSLQKKYTEPSRYKQFYKEIHKIKPKSILEVGVWDGEVALKMIGIAKRYNTVSYYGFDLFEDLTEEQFRQEKSRRPLTIAEIKNKLSDSNADIRLYKGNTLETLKIASQSLPKIDFIYIDGGHSLETVESDWNNCKELMHHNTVVMFDDYWQNREDGGCKPIINSIDKSKYLVEIMPALDCYDNKDFGRLEIKHAKVQLR